MYIVIILFLMVQLSFGDGSDGFSATTELRIIPQSYDTNPAPPPEHIRIDDVSKPLILEAFARLNTSEFDDNIFRAITSYLNAGFYFYPENHQLVYALPSQLREQIIKIHKALIDAVSPTNSSRTPIAWLYDRAAFPPTEGNRDAINAAYYLTQVVLAWER